MHERLASLGVRGVPARTFHSAALAQLHFFRQGEVGRVRPSKVVALKQITNRLPRPHRFHAVSDLANEIEWAKNRRLTPDNYAESIGRHEPPIPLDLMRSVFTEYERRKDSRGELDFEDVLELAVRLYEQDSSAAAAFRDRYHAFTVDEYQDVNFLQNSLLDQWLGDRDDLCVVGDDYQSIYSFTGATAAYLLDMPARYPAAVVVRLEENHRSTPQILDLANRLTPHLKGSSKVLRAVRLPGPDPVLRSFPDPHAEVDFIVGHAQACHEKEKVPYEAMAVLYRINASSDDFEEAFSHADVPFQVRSGAFLARPAVRQTLRLLRRVATAPASESVDAAALEQGLTDRIPDGVGDAEITRQHDLARLVRLARDFPGNAQGFIIDLESRFGAETEGRGVNLLTYHRAKGLEFEVVFLPTLEEGQLPFRRSTSVDEIAEERRLFYVGLTRARSRLCVTWSLRGQPSRFLHELDRADTNESSGEQFREPTANEAALLEALRQWRVECARNAGLPPTWSSAMRPSKNSRVSGQARLKSWQQFEVSGRRSSNGLGRTFFRSLGQRLLRRAASRGWRLALELVGEDSGSTLLLEALRQWRVECARNAGLPPYMVFGNGRPSKNSRVSGQARLKSWQQFEVSGRRSSNGLGRTFFRSSGQRLLRRAASRGWRLALKSAGIRIHTRCTQGVAASPSPS